MQYNYTQNKKVTPALHRYPVSITQCLLDSAQNIAEIELKLILPTLHLAEMRKFYSWITDVLSLVYSLQGGSLMHRKSLGSEFGLGYLTR